MYGAKTTPPWRIEPIAGPVKFSPETTRASGEDEQAARDTVARSSARRIAGAEPSTASSLVAGSHRSEAAEASPLRSRGGLPDHAERSAGGRVEDLDPPVEHE